MEKSNIIISIIIVICIAAGVSAYGLTSDENIFNTLQGLGSAQQGNGIGNNSTNNTVITNSSGSYSGDSPYGTDFYYSGDGTSSSGSGSGSINSGGSNNPASNIQPSNTNNNQNSQDATAVAYVIKTQNDDGSITETYYNIYDEPIGFHTYGPNIDEGGGGAPDHPYEG